MSVLSRKSLFVMLLSLALFVSCDEQPAHTAPPEPLPQTTQTPSPASPQQFDRGSDAQRETLVSIRTALLEGGDDATLIKLLTQLFYSEPESLLQVGGGIELARHLIALEQFEPASGVLAELDVIDIPAEHAHTLSMEVVTLHVAFASAHAMARVGPPSTLEPSTPQEDGP